MEIIEIKTKDNSFFALNPLLRPFPSNTQLIGIEIRSDGVITDVQKVIDPYNIKLTYTYFLAYTKPFSEITIPILVKSNKDGSFILDKTEPADFYVLSSNDVSFSENCSPVPLGKGKTLKECLFTRPPNYYYYLIGILIVIIVIFAN